MQSTANTIGELLNLPLTNEEENHLVKYLQNSGDVSGKKLVVLYYLQQSRLIDAISTNGIQKVRRASQMTPQFNQ